jgi:hypothetical protein
MARGVEREGHDAGHVEDGAMIVLDDAGEDRDLRWLDDLHGC